MEMYDTKFKKGQNYTFYSTLLSARLLWCSPIITYLENLNKQQYLVQNNTPDHL